MYKIGIVGHTPDVFSITEDTRNKLNETLDLLNFQYNKDLIFNISTNIGIGLWAAKYCFDTDKAYHLFLSHSPETLSEHWYDDQKQDLNLVYKYAKAITIIKLGDKFSDINVANEHIVENSNFTVVFWDGRLQGQIYNTIKYSLENNRMVINGFDLKAITNDDLKAKNNFGE